MPLRALVAFVLAFVLAGAPAARAQSEDQPPSGEPPAAQPSSPEGQPEAKTTRELGDKLQLGWIATLDERFGTWVVDPLATAMFFDLMFWDDELPLGAGVGEVFDGREVISWTEAGYVLADRATLDPDEVAVHLDEPVRRTIDGLEVHVLSDEGDLAGAIPSQRVDLPRWGVEPAPEAGEAVADRVVEVQTESGLPVEVDRVRSVVTADRVDLPDDLIAPVAGLSVRHDSATWQVVEVTDEGALEVRSTATEIHEGRLADPDDHELPLVVAWLVLGAVFFTLRMNFVNLFAFGHALKVTSGAYDDPDDPGEISHFQALTSALSATVGLGNIAGVAIAVATGGPGAVFWMVVAGFLGMASKFTECTLGQLYRIEKPDGSVSGGPMHYLEDGLKELGLGPLGKGLAVLFALMCIGGSLGGGNMFQANQSFAAVSEVVPAFGEVAWLYGILLALSVGLVIIGGIRRIGTATSMIVPVMCIIYVAAGLWILIANAAVVPAAFSTILTEAFTPSATYGGFLGVLVQGFRRAAFSNEAGVGSAAIAHSAASTRYAVREGIVALLEPFIDTIIVCTMTGLVIVVSGAYLQQGVGDGVLLTSSAFATVIDWFPLVLSFAVVMFAFSTMISWSYYGERCTTWLLGDWASMPYRVVFLFCVFFGAVFELGNVLTFSDLMVLGMAFPNILGAVLLSNKVKRALDDYWGKLKAGELPSMKERRAA